MLTDHPLDLKRLFTPMESCVSLRLGEVHGAEVERLEAGPYNVAPVLDEADRVVGTVETKVARHLVEQNQPLAGSDLLPPYPRIPPVPHLGVRLGVLSESQFGLVGEDTSPGALRDSGVTAF